MACRGVYFALSSEQEARLLAAVGEDEAVLELIQEEIEESWDVDWLYETDKAWDAIHRCLTDGQLSTSNGVAPLNLCVLGGKQLYAGDDYFVCFVDKEQVPSVAAALATFTRERFVEAYSRLTRTNYEGPVGDDDREYTWSYLDEMKPFWQRAAAASRSVVFTVDQ